MSDNRIPRGVAAVAAGIPFSHTIEQVNVVGQAKPAHMISSVGPQGEPHAGIYDDFGQLKATASQEYAEIPLFRVVDNEGLPGANGVTVEILGEIAPTGLEVLLTDLEKDGMRQGFVDELRQKADNNKGFIDLSYPTPVGYGVMRNLANRALEQYGATLSSDEVAALTQFRDEAAAKSSPRISDTFLMPGIDASFRSLSGPAGEEIFGPGNGVVLGTDPVVLPEESKVEEKK
ncbi:MAG: hypothetical protein ACT4TC_10550 [Myxococcaceae bacterium]